MMRTGLTQHSIKHVAIIMDGNGRWASRRSRPRVWGHIRGSSVVSPIIEKADDLGIKTLTLYAFSTENWQRPDHEIKILFTLLRKYLQKERARIIKNNIRFKIIGDLTQLPLETKHLVQELEEDTRENTGLNLVFAFGYGGRKDIVQAANAFYEDHPDRILSEESLNDYLMTSGYGDVDLLIRTGGDQRVSNFLLWQIAYAELYFTQTAWPDFTAQEFEVILDEISQRERRFGQIFEGKNSRQNPTGYSSAIIS